MKPFFWIASTALAIALSPELPSAKASQRLQFSCSCEDGNPACPTELNRQSFTLSLDPASEIASVRFAGRDGTFNGTRDPYSIIRDHKFRGYSRYVDWSTARHEFFPSRPFASLLIENILFDGGYDCSHGMKCGQTLVMTGVNLAESYLYQCEGSGR
mgnify:CR=1 FL=1